MDDLSTMTIERLRRKEDQAWEMAGCARQDRDAKDEARWTAEAQRYQDEIARRRRDA